MELATVTAALTPLALLACPIGMGVMMWMMGRGSKGQRGDAPPQPASVEMLRAQQRQLDADIARLESRGAGTEPIASRP